MGKRDKDRTVVIADNANKVYTTANYWQVEDTNAPAYIANVSAWCSTCHTRYLAAEASAGGGGGGGNVGGQRH